MKKSQKVYPCEINDTATILRPSGVVSNTLKLAGGFSLNIQAPMTSKKKTDVLGTRSI